MQKPMDLNGPGAETVAEAEAAPGRPEPIELNGLGAETVAMLWTEAFYRSFDNRTAARRFRRIGGNAVEERLDRSRPGRLDGQSPLAPDDDPIGLVVANPPAELGADAGTSSGPRGATKLQKKKMVVALARKLLAGAVAIRRRRRRDRERRAEARRPGALRPPQERTFFHRSAEVRSTSVDPGGRTDGLLGLKTRGEEGLALTGLPPAKQDQGARSLKRDDRMWIVPAIDQSAEGSAQDRRIRTTRGETHETLKSTRSAQSRKRLSTAAPSISCS